MTYFAHSHSCRVYASLALTLASACWTRDSRSDRRLNRYPMSAPRDATTTPANVRTAPRSTVRLSSQCRSRGTSARPSCPAGTRTPATGSQATGPPRSTRRCSGPSHRRRGGSPTPPAPRRRPTRATPPGRPRRSGRSCGSGTYRSRSRGFSFSCLAGCRPAVVAERGSAVPGRARLPRLGGDTIDRACVRLPQTLVGQAPLQRLPRLPTPHPVDHAPLPRGGLEVPGVEEPLLQPLRPHRVGPAGLRATHHKVERPEQLLVRGS